MDEDEEELDVEPEELLEELDPPEELELAPPVPGVTTSSSASAAAAAVAGSAMIEQTFLGLGCLVVSLV